jgi:putative phosphoribosyl transferase
VTIGQEHLPGALDIPERASGLVIFAHGAGSSRLSPRNAHAARCLQEFGLATLLFDLLTEAEAADRLKVFDINLLGVRVVEAIDWARKRSEAAGLPIGLLGASTGVAAALHAAAERADAVRAVVSRGGRPDLAGQALERVRCPVLLLVGGADTAVLALHREAQHRLVGRSKLEIIPGAGHLFEEPGALDAALGAAGDWFYSYLEGPVHAGSDL